MRTAQLGDRVQVHVVKRPEDGSAAPPRRRTPREVTVGVDPPRLAGLGKALVDLAPGDCKTFTVPAEQAYGLRDAGRVYRLSRQRFREGQELVPGRWVRLTDRHGRRRLVRILLVGDKTVVVDGNHPRAGQALRLEVKLIAIHGPDPQGPGPAPANSAAESRAGEALLRAGKSGAREAGNGDHR